MSKPVKIGIFLPRSLHRRLKLVLAKHGTTAQAELLPAIEKLVEELEQREPETEAVAS